MVSWLVGNKESGPKDPPSPRLRRGRPGFGLPQRERFKAQGTGSVLASSRQQAAGSKNKNAYIIKNSMPWFIVVKIFSEL